MGEISACDCFNEELIDGKVYIMSSVTGSEHVRTMDTLYFEFSKYLKAKKCIASTDALAIYYEGEESKNYVCPDLTVTCDKNKFSERGYEGVPDLVVEILSPSTRKYDKTIKFNLYERIGVKEFWIIEHKAKSIEQYILKNGKYELYEVVAIISEWELENLPKDKQESYTTIIKPTIFNDLEIDIKDVFDF